MKVLFLIPKRKTRSILPAPDVGLAYVARAALEAGAMVKVLDGHKEEIGPGSLVHVLQKEKFDLIGIKCLSIDFPSVMEYCKVIKQVRPEAFTVLGGPHPSALPEETMKESDVDVVIRGEGESAFSSLIRSHIAHHGRIPVQDLSQIPNLAYRGETKEVLLNPVEFSRDLDSIGFPAWELFDIPGYPELPGSGGKFLPIITSRGCPSHCTFCCSASIHGRKVRMRSPEHVIREIEWLLSRFDIERVSVFDNNFCFHRNHVLEFCRLYREKQFTVPFDIPQGIRIDGLDRTVVDALEQAG